ncbi:2%2C3%2C4%2C5-tetrahydropyridine-2%2C6-dicarboxy late N-acetyltransferase [uncultured Clostridium sp.]|uniref:N-acetyltransferase n=1 Tax=uncultured Clostridium sp. TaxID=59620 RepID=UPI000821FA02|nr:N-acetyltransferase [uncultured Clostridium sp.]SCJ41455.1 2%2C3%2C4%2C5-tetrahydropyridine-2%2C6-dicarboxy late N-acetyltransferase [uncultured Clostridium sp.]
MSLIKGDNVTIKDNVIIGENVILEDDVYIDYGAIIKDNVHIKKGTYIGSSCILGEYLYDFFKDKINKRHLTLIGENSIIRSRTIIYGDTIIGDNFQTGHGVTIREKNNIGNNVRIGTNSDIQHECTIGNYVSIHSSVFMGEETEIEDFVWIFPNVVITNDATPPSNTITPVKIKKYASICARSTLLPGVVIGEKSLVCAGAVVSKDIEAGIAVAGVPAKKVKMTKDIINKNTGLPAYPWMESFERGMPWKDIGFNKWEKLMDKI